MLDGGIQQGCSEGVMRAKLGMKYKNTHLEYPRKTSLGRRDSKSGDGSVVPVGTAGEKDKMGRERMRTMGEPASDVRLIVSG